MVINIKHFVITIIAIFLSLGVGIFIGVIIDSQHLFIEQQKVIVSQIEEEFDGFRQKNYELMSDLDDYKTKNIRRDKFLDIIYNKLTEENLNDSNVMIINMLSDEDYLNIEGVLNDVGIKGVMEVEIPMDSSEYIEALSSTLKRGLNIENLSKDEVLDIKNEKMVSRLLKKGCSLLPYSLKQIEFLEYKGSIHSSIDYVIIIDDGFKINNKHYKEVRKEFINIMKSENIPVMVIEKSDGLSSSMPFYKELDVSTVDNGDTMIGKLTMLMILKGRKGHFGEKETAEYLFPDDFLVFE